MTPPSGMQPTDTEVTSAALAQLDRLQTLFGRVEGKASFLFAVDLALLGSVAVATPFGAVGSPAGMSGLIATVLLGFSMINLCAAFYPHLKNPRASVLYFADIARLSAEEYRTRIRGGTPAEVADDALCQVWRNARILDKKFNRSRSAFLLAAAAIPFWLALLGIGVAEGGKLPLP